MHVITTSPLNNRLYPAIFLTLAMYSGVWSYGQKHNEKEIESAMHRYDYFIQKMDADSIAHLYAPDGNLGDIAHGRDSIRTFLKGFKNVSVLYQASVTDSVRLSGDQAMQYGTYKQIAVMNKTDTARLKGSFTASWIWLPTEGWRIRKMNTKPVN
jgi:hypothetical protein